jgi:alpha-tubulin suppressor-like RCC1 family protein
MSAAHLGVVIKAPLLRANTLTAHSFSGEPSPEPAQHAVTQALTWGAGSPPAPVAKLARRTLTDVSCAGSSVAYLTDAGEVLVSGANDEGQLLPEDASLALAQPALVESLAAQRASSVALGEHHVAVVTSAGGALSWGSNEYLALAHTRDAAPPFRVPPRLMRGLPPAAHRVAQVSVGPSHTLLLTRGGEVFAAGSGLRGALARATASRAPSSRAWAGRCWACP